MTQHRTRLPVSFTTTLYDSSLAYDTNLGYDGMTINNTQYTTRPIIGSPASNILTELDEILLTESGLPLVFEYGTPGTTYTTRIIPT